MSRIYVGNLSYGTTEDSLRQAFEERGHKVRSVAVITDRETGRPRGFAFVEVEAPADRDAAIQDLDGVELDGRNLRVSEARERSSGPRGGGGGGGGGYGGGGGGYGGGGGPRGGGDFGGRNDRGGGDRNDRGGRGGRKRRGRGRDRDRDRDRGDY